MKRGDLIRPRRHAPDGQGPPWELRVMASLSTGAAGGGRSVLETCGSRGVAEDADLRRRTPRRAPPRPPPPGTEVRGREGQQVMGVRAGTLTH